MCPQQQDSPVDHQADIMCSDNDMDTDNPDCKGMPGFIY